ncbi:MAG TPA: response regulator [Steroidobacteraceae bacterium]|jgi:DNA-binding NtrC family response regulator|nr:response regulator [Steroidobacteraceae bacterium]
MQRPITMLIADDSHVSRQLLMDAARASKLPLRLSTTDNGRDCLTLLNGSNIDLAFIDVQMPELSGTEAFWSARKQGIQTFVTLMSNPPATEAVEIAIKLRAYEFLFKPFGVQDALAIMKTYARIAARTKVLIVDDSSAVRQIVQKIVHGSVFNCAITEAGDGETALALGRGNEFDVAFLDCNMPGLSGLVTLKRLRLVQPPMKVVMISAERNLASETQALDGGACTFLHKPFTSADVDRVLHAAFGLRSPNLKLNSSEPSFDVAIEGSTIRLAHRDSGHIFEYLWSQRPPYLRNGIIHAARACDIAPARVAPVAAQAALAQLRTANLLAA